MIFARLRLAAAAIAIATGAAAQGQAPYTTLASPQPVPAGDRIEVIEFFWYGCDHCYRLEPAIEAWLPKVRKDVAFRRVPAIAGGAWAAHAQIHYTLEAIGRLEDLRPRIFEAIHKDGLRLEQPAVLAKWLAAQDIDPERYAEAGKSFGVLAKMKQAEGLTRAYRLEGVPMMVVNGRYATNPAQAGGAAKMFQVIDHLVAKERWK